MKKGSAIKTPFIRRLWMVLFLLIVLMGSSYVLITLYFSEKYFEEATQRLNSNVASHVIEEKFTDQSPILEDGTVNKALFGDLMHDMMAVNRAIEVFLLDKSGAVLYSVVLDHSNPNQPSPSVDLAPIHQFIEENGQRYILGDDPRNPGIRKIFSAAEFQAHGDPYFIYIVLAGKEFEEIAGSLQTNYFLRLGAGSMFVTMIFVGLLALISIWFLTKNLREILYSVRRFSEGDIKARVPNPDRSDLSELALSFNQMADTIENTMDEIKSVDRLRRELIANVSHDLRTPLAVIQGYLETLQIKKDQLSPAEKEDYYHIIRDNSERVSNMVGQLFEYSKLEAKQIEAVKEPFALSDLLMEVQKKFQILASKKNIDLSLKLNNKVPLVFADISLVERALQNLVDNAIKFTPEYGKVAIETKVNSDSVEVWIEDSGPGIPEQQLSEIFERYKKADSTQKSIGAGLGLAIAQKIMALHNSTIEVISKPNEGAAFHFQLPAYSV